MKDGTNYPNPQTADHVLNTPRLNRAKVKTEIGFGIASAPLLLNCIVSCFVMIYFITNGTVSYEYLRLFGIV